MRSCSWSLARIPTTRRFCRCRSVLEVDAVREDYRFTFKTDGRARVEVTILDGAKPVGRRDPNWEDEGSPFVVAWLPPPTAREGWYRLLLSGQFEDGKKLDKVMQFYHRAAGPATKYNLGNGAACRLRISYSHKDEAWKDRLVSHLRVLEYEGALDVWDDRRIGAGDEWRQEIQTALDKATVAIPDHLEELPDLPLHSRAGTDQIWPAGRKGSLKVIPLIAEPCAWEQAGAPGHPGTPCDGRPLSAVSSHQVDADLPALAVEIVSGRIDQVAGVDADPARRMTARAWLIATLAISGIAATMLTYAAYHWHLDTNVRLDLFTERLSFAGRGTKAQSLDLGIQFSRLTFAGCGGAEFEGLTLEGSGSTVSLPHV